MVNFSCSGLFHMKTRVSLQYLWMIVACCLYFAFFTIMPANVILLKIKFDAVVEHRINDGWTSYQSYQSCYNHILTLHFWGSVLQWSTIKTKYLNFTFFQHFYILTMVNHVAKDDQQPVSVFNHGIKDLNRHVRTISWHCSF